jgi:hypothetical protein
MQALPPQARRHGSVGMQLQSRDASGRKEKKQSEIPIGRPQRDKPCRARNCPCAPRAATCRSMSGHGAREVARTSIFAAPTVGPQHPPFSTLDFTFRRRGSSAAKGKKGELSHCIVGRWPLWLARRGWIILEQLSRAASRLESLRLLRWIATLAGPWSRWALVGNHSLCISELTGGCCGCLHFETKLVRHVIITVLRTCVHGYMTYRSSLEKNARHKPSDTRSRQLSGKKKKKKKKKTKVPCVPDAETSLPEGGELGTTVSSRFLCQLRIRPQIRSTYSILCPHMETTKTHTLDRYNPQTHTEAHSSPVSVRGAETEHKAHTT